MVVFCRWRVRLTWTCRVTWWLPSKSLYSHSGQVFLYLDYYCLCMLLYIVCSYRKLWWIEFIFCVFIYGTFLLLIKWPLIKFLDCKLIVFWTLIFHQPWDKILKQLVVFNWGLTLTVSNAQSGTKYKAFSVSFIFFYVYKKISLTWLHFIVITTLAKFSCL